jgi:hypothetical protein
MLNKFARLFRGALAVGVLTSLVAVSSAQVTQLWAKRLGASGPQREIGATVARSTSATYVAGVSYGGFLEDPIAPRLWLAKYDTNGARTWLINRPAPDGGSYTIISMQPDAAGNPVLLLSSQLFDGIPDGGARFSSEVICFRSNDGGVAWRHAVNTEGDFSNIFFPVSLRIDSAGGIYIAGGNFSSFRVRKLNGATGAVIWNGSAVNGTDQAASCAALAIDSGNNPVVTGYTLPLDCSSFSNAKVMTAKFNGATGATSWVRTYSLANQGDQGKFIATSGTNVMVGAQSNSSTGQNVAAMVQYDSAGAQTRAVRYAGGVPSAPVNINGLAVDGTGRVVIAGTAVDALFNFGAFVARWAATGTAAPTTKSIPDSQFGFRNFRTESRVLALDGAGNPVLTVIDTSVPTPRALTAKFDAATLNNVLFSDLYSIAGFEVEPAAVATSGTETSIVGTRFSATGKFPNIIVRTLTAAGANKWTADSSGAPATGFQDIASAVARNAAGETYTIGTSAGRILCTKHDANGNQLWQTTFLPNPTGAPDPSAAALDIIVDNQNNPIMSGRAQGINFVTKLAAANGARTWVRQLTGQLGDNNRTMTFDSANNVYVVLNNGAAAGLAKIGASVGTVLWQATVTNPMDWTSEANSVAIDASSNPFIVGTRRKNTAGTCPDTGVDDRILVAKFSTTNGSVTFQSISSGGILGDANGEAIGIDGSGNAVVTGSVAGTNPVQSRVHTLKFNGTSGALLNEAFFSPVGAAMNTPTDIVVNRTNNQVTVVTLSFLTATGYNASVVRYNPSLAQTWVYNLRTTGSTLPIGISRAVGSSGNNIYLAGFEQTVSQNPTMFTMRVNAAGTFGWRQNYKGFATGFDFGADLIYHEPSKQVVTIGPSLGSGSGYDGAVIRYQEP